MVHQPNSLDSLDGEAPLPFDPVPVRFDSGKYQESLVWQTSIMASPRNTEVGALANSIFRFFCKTLLQVLQLTHNSCLLGICFLVHENYSQYFKKIIKKLLMIVALYR